MDKLNQNELEKQSGGVVVYSTATWKRVYTSVVITDVDKIVADVEQNALLNSGTKEDLRVKLTHFIGSKTDVSLTVTVTTGSYNCNNSLTQSVEVQ